MNGILRSFARRTSLTPQDQWAIVGEPPMFLPDEIRAVHVCAVFTYDLPECKRLARAYQERLPGVPVEIGGPATGMPGGEFVPGLYVATGSVITSRGCPNRCWFCSVWKREGAEVRELPICDGYNVLDDNLLACSESHIRGVFAMLARQPRRAEFTGGLEAARLTDWQADLLCDLHPERLFFAYDTPDDWEPLVVAVRKLTDRGMPTAGHRIRAYVLCGHPRDTMDAAEKRLRDALSIGVFPMAMLWRDNEGRRDPEWMRFARTWANPTIIGARH